MIKSQQLDPSAMSCQSLPARRCITTETNDGIASGHGSVKVDRVATVFQYCDVTTVGQLALQQLGSTGMNDLKQQVWYD